MKKSPVWYRCRAQIPGLMSWAKFCHPLPGIPEKMGPAIGLCSHEPRRRRRPLAQDVRDCRKTRRDLEIVPQGQYRSGRLPSQGVHLGFGGCEKWL